MTTTPATGCPVDESFDPLSPEFLADPYAVMAKVEAPVFFAPSIGYYVVTRYTDIEEVFKNPATYSAAAAQAPLVPLAPEAQQILLAGGHRPQPSMASLVDLKVATPGDDLASDLVAIHDEAPDRLTLDECASILFSLSFAGHETTTGLISNTVRRLLEDPARWDEIVKQPDLIPRRSRKPSATTRRWPSGAGSPPARSRWPAWTSPRTPACTCGLAAAGRDRAEFPEPDRFDLHRPDAERHLAFGKGQHFCLGANFGRLEAQIAIAELARRYPRLRLAPDQEFTFHPNISFRGPGPSTSARNSPSDQTTER